MFIGIDVGSISSKIAIINNENKIIYQNYSFNNGNPLATVRTIISEAIDHGYVEYYSLCATGSGRKFIGEALNAELVKNEITATWQAVALTFPTCNTILEIGGQDSKLIALENGEITHFKLNSVCAAGTGSFLQQQAFRLGVSLGQLSQLAVNTVHKAKFSGRCTVFVETEMINLQQRGYGLNAIAAGLLDAVCENYLKDLGPGIQLRAPYIFCGGVSEIEAIRNNFEQKLQAPIHVPEYNKITAAYGAALLAKHYYLSNTSQTSPPKQLTMPRGKAPKVSLQCGRSDCLNCGKCTPSNQ